MQEIELKFQIPAERRAALWSAVQGGRLGSMALRAHYFDTPDGLLASQAIALRLRHEGDCWVQTLKACEGNSAVRLEHNARLDVAADAVPALDPARHAGSPAHHELRRVLGSTADGGRSLREVYRTEVQRHSRLLRAPGGALVELAFDEGQLIAGQVRHPICEIEFELKSGPVSGLFALASLWAERHGLWLDTVSKSERGHLLARGLAHAPAAKARPPRFAARPDPQQFARACIEACLAQVLPNASALAAGSAQPEHLHQLRVGLRRLRVALSELTEFDSGIDAAWEPQLARLFGALGLERDRQMLAKLGEALLAAGSPPLPALPAAAPAGGLSKRLRAGDTQQLLLAVLAFATGASPASGPAFEGCPLEAVGTRLDRLRHRLKRASRRFAEASVEAQHRMRKRLKRLRYLAGLVAPFYGARPARDCLQALRSAQDALGRCNDEALALDHFREHAARGHAGACFAVGWLTSQQTASHAAAAKALRAATHAPRFWHGKKPRRAPKPGAYEKDGKDGAGGAAAS